MTKSEEYGKSTKKTLRTAESIIEDLTSTDPLDCMFAIKYCVVRNVNDKKIVDIIKDLKTSDLIEWHTCKISDCAYAALDLLGIEKYEGDNVMIRDYIDTVFYTQMDGAEQ